jgi:hypothetical protein
MAGAALGTAGLAFDHAWRATGLLVNEQRRRIEAVAKALLQWGQLDEDEFLKTVSYASRKIGFNGAACSRCLPSTHIAAQADSGVAGVAARSASDFNGRI